MNELRNNFMQIAHIAKIIRDHDAHYCDKGNWWLCPDDDQFAESYLDGAWFMYQELHK